ncbi:MAG: cupredoxin domain-containing protein [Nitrososphaeraceae archaeon]
MLKGISRNKSLPLAALFLALALMVAPSASRNILAYPAGRMAVQQEGYTYGQKTSVKDAPVGAISSSSTNSSTSGQEKSSNNTIQLNAQEKKGVYTWSNKHGINPVLTFKLDVNNVVHIKNPTDSKHQLIITSSGSQAASSGDVNPGSTGQLSFSPTTAGTFQYHCLYHPTTMKGTIKISP